MPTVLTRGNEVSTGEEFELQGFTRLPVVSVFVEESIKGTETPVEISLSEGTDPPNPVLSAHILGLPLGDQAQELTTITTLTAELHDEEGTVVELYDPANWNWAVVSGGGSFTGDDLTLPAAPATVRISATHPTEGLVATADISVVATVTFTADFFNLPAQLIEGQQTNPLRSRVLDADGSTVEQINANWTYSVLSGPGAISGSGGNQVLVANPGSAPGSITVRATYTGSLNVSPAIDDQTTSVVAQPQPGDFPEVLQPAGHTEIENLNGSTKIWAGWNQGGEWIDDNVRVEVVSDPLSKFGNAIEKRFFFGENWGGWKGTSNRNIGLWRELYVRFVFAFSPNWVWHPGGGKYAYMHNSGTGNDKKNVVLGPATNQNAAETAFGIAPTAGRNVYFIDESSGHGQWVANLPGLSRGDYHTFESLIGADIGTNDGYIRQAVDGVEATQWVLVGDGEVRDLRDGQNWLFNNNVPDKRVGSLFETFLFNGGSGGTVPADIYVRLSELYISGRN